jgi:hypothetical protein
LDEDDDGTGFGDGSNEFCGLVEPKNREAALTLRTFDSVVGLQKRVSIMHVVV